jgi:hypothetical protein
VAIAKEDDAAAVTVAGVTLDREPSSRAVGANHFGEIRVAVIVRETARTKQRHRGRCVRTGHELSDAKNQDQRQREEAIVPLIPPCGRGGEF